MKAQGLASSLGLDLYPSLDSVNKKLFKRAMRAVEVILKSSTSGSVESQRQVVKQIVKIEAFKSPVDKIRRLFCLNQETITCERTKTETLRSFLDLLVSAEQRYLNVINADQDSAESQNFSFALFRNTRVAPTTFTNIFSSLVNQGHEP